MKKAAIIGFGRFGELLAGLCAPTFTVTIIESNPKRAHEAEAQGYTVEPLDAVTQADFIFLAVPISEIEQTITKLAPLVGETQVVVDLCSVKVFPVNLMKLHMAKTQLVGTHPMFGPDSAQKGLEGLQVAICPVNVTPENLQVLKSFWSGKGANVIETTPENHDRDVVYSQAFTYSLAKIILNMNRPKLPLKPGASMRYAKLRGYQQTIVSSSSMTCCSTTHSLPK